MEVLGECRGFGSDFAKLGGTQPSGELLKRTRCAQRCIFPPAIWSPQNEAALGGEGIKQADGFGTEEPPGPVMETELSRYVRPEGIQYRELSAYIIVGRARRGARGPPHEDTWLGSGCCCHCNWHLRCW